MQRQVEKSIRVPAFLTITVGEKRDQLARGSGSCGGDCVRSTTPGPQSKVRLCQCPIVKNLSIVLGECLIER